MSDDRGGSWREVSAPMPNRTFMVEKPYNDPETLYLAGVATSAQQLVASAWHGQNTYDRSTGLLAGSQTNDIAVLE